MPKITELSKEKKFREIYKKLCTHEMLSEWEKEYILGVALLLLKKFDNKDDNRIDFELAYHIILSYSVLTDDYEPLNDIAYNCGFFPIVRYINEHELLKKLSIKELLYDYTLEKYRKETYIETYEQKITRKNLVTAEGNLCFIAPTSSGKSSIVFEHIKKHDSIRKVLIIVPTKSLLSQTYVNVRQSITDRKVFCHDEMYSGDKNFVGVLTQERTLRLLEKNHGLEIDCIYVDEAHNLFNNDSRNILLARAIKQCSINNPNLKIVYLSPFIADVDNLLLKDQKGANTIGEQRISYNMKEPEIYEMRKEGIVYLYNRFFGCFWEIKNGYNLFSYIHDKSLRKNFIFIRSPRKIETFAKELYSHTNAIEQTHVIRELKRTMEKYVHSSFMEIEMLNHGILYLHAKIPDILKDYLEYQFKIIPEIRYLIANMVILEGINLPFDNLFVLDATGMQSSNLLNLIGRVNRLNDVFNSKTGDLQKLIPKIHFVNSQCYSGKTKMQNKITHLYDIRSDEVINPLLLNYNIEKLKRKKESIESIKAKNEEILEIEKTFFKEPEDEIERLKKLLIKNRIDQLISLDVENCTRILHSIRSYREIKTVNISVLDKVKAILVDKIDVKDQSFKRLGNDAAIRYYKHFINSARGDSLKGQIESQFKFFKSQLNIGNYYMYVGLAYGECLGPYKGDKTRGKVYIDLRKKNERELINLLIVKTKIEQDFLSYQYLCAVCFLHDVNVISEDEYNLELYGTTDASKIELLKLGISVGLLKILSREGQLSNLEKDSYGNIQGNAKLKEFYSKSDDYTQFEIRKYIRMD